MRNQKSRLETVLLALASVALLSVSAAIAAPPDDPNQDGNLHGGCPGPWDLEDINQWEEVDSWHHNSCANPEVRMQLNGEHHFLLKIKDCGDGTRLINKHISHGKVYARAQRRIPEGFEGHVAEGDENYVTEAELQAWLADHPAEGGDERAMPAGWYETIWNSNGIINENRRTRPGEPNNQVFICHFVSQKNPYTGVKEDYLYHRNQHWTMLEAAPWFEVETINEFTTCPGQGGTMTKICYPDIDANCPTG